MEAMAVTVEVAATAPAAMVDDERCGILRVRGLVRARLIHSF